MAMDKSDKRELLVTLLCEYRDELRTLAIEVRNNFNRIQEIREPTAEVGRWAEAADEDEYIVSRELDKVCGLISNLKTLQSQKKFAVAVTNLWYDANSPHVMELVLTKPAVPKWDGKPHKVHCRDAVASSKKTLCGQVLSKDWTDYEARPDRSTITCVNCKHAWENLQRVKA